MTSKMFCVLSNDPKLTAFEVDIDRSTSVSSLKKAIHAERVLHLKGVDAPDLTLVRIFKAGVGGLTKKELTRSKDPFNLTAYCEDPEDEDDAISVFQSAPGFCWAKDGLFFK
ncbi:hypothetical protein HK100_010219, partial [Physocladia obscura]